MNAEELKAQLVNYELGFISGLELICSYMDYLSCQVDGFSEPAAKVAIEADKRLSVLTHKVMKEIKKL